MSSKKLSFMERVEAMASAAPIEKPKRDVRAEIAGAIKVAGIPQAKVSEAIGARVQNFNNYLQGRRALPYNQIECILWLLDGEKEG